MISSTPFTSVGWVNGGMEQNGKPEGTISMSTLIGGQEPDIWNADRILGGVKHVHPDGGLPQLYAGLMPPDQPDQPEIGGRFNGMSNKIVISGTRVAYGFGSRFCAFEHKLMRGGISGQRQSLSGGHSKFSLVIGSKSVDSQEHLFAGQLAHRRITARKSCARASYAVNPYGIRVRVDGYRAVVPFFQVHIPGYLYATGVRTQQAVHPA
jgi:hypothetical protein